MSIPSAHDLAKSAQTSVNFAKLHRVIEALRVKLQHPSDEDNMEGNVSEGFELSFLGIAERAELMRKGYGVIVGSGGVSYDGESKGDRVFVTCPLPHTLPHTRMR